MDEIKVEKLERCISQQSDGQYIAHYKNLLLKSVFQPIYHKDMSITGLEALVRIHTDDEQIIRPDEFFHSAHTCQDDKLCVERLSRLIHIRNFSLSAFSDKKLFLNVLPNAVERLSQEALSCRVLLKNIVQYGLTPSQVVMELIELDAHCEQQLQQATLSLSDRGFLWAIDDFGIAASNQARTERIKPYIIKLDRSLLYQYEQGEHQFLLNAVALARRINAMIVIEGIETEHQLTLMQQLNLDMYQGYHLAMPAPVHVQKLAKISCL